jgi:hypothetical protein
MKSFKKGNWEFVVVSKNTPPPLVAPLKRGIFNFVNPKIQCIIVNFF